MAGRNYGPLPQGYVGLDQVCKDLGLSGRNAFGNKRRRTPDKVPPMERLTDGRLAIKSEDYAAWIRRRNAADAVRLSQELAERARDLRQELVELEARALDTRDALAS